MGVFSDPEVQGAEEGGGGTPPWFQPGTYLVDLAQLKDMDPNDPDPRKRPRNGKCFVINAHVVGVKSSHPKAPGEGTLAGQVISGLDSNKQDRKEMALSDMKAFACMLVRALGGDPDKFTAEQWESFDKKTKLDDGRALASKVPTLKLECYMSKRGTFTVHKWRGKATAEDKEEFGVA